MKILKVIGIIILVLVVLYVGIGLFLPKHTHVERSIVINAPTEKVFNEVNTFNNLKEWSPWAKLDPNTKWNYSGPEYGVGAKYDWVSDDKNVGTGAQEIIESTPNEYVKTKMNFGNMEGDYFAEFLLKPAEGGTKVTWTYDGDMNSMMEKYVGTFFMDGILGPPYEQGLSDLKTYIEGLPDAEPEIMEVDSTAVEDEMME